MSSYLKTNCCQNIAQKCCSGKLYAPKEDTEVAISKLNSKITKLEQQEKDFELLNQEYKQLENEFILMNEAKLRLEYEIKQREETFNKRYTDLKGINENLKNALNDKTCVYNKLMEEKNCLEKHLKGKNDEIDEINRRINDNENKINSTMNNNGGFQKELEDLNDINMNQKNKIEELLNDKQKLIKLCKDQEHSLNLSEKEKMRWNNKLRDDNAKISNLNSKLKIHSNNLNILRKQLDDSNTINLKLQNNLKNLDNELTCHKTDNQNLRNQLMIEENMRKEQDQRNEKLKCIMLDRKNKLNCINNDYNKMVSSHNYMSQDKCMRKNENVKLNDSVRTLTHQNQALIDEIERGIKEDEYMKNVLSRNNRMSFVLKENDSMFCNVPKDMMICHDFCDSDTYGGTYTKKTYMETNPNISKNVTFWPKCTHTLK